MLIRNLFWLLLGAVVSLVSNAKATETLAIMNYKGILKGQPYKGAVQKNQAWLPLPLNYRNQVPLDFTVEVLPTSIVKYIEYKSDDIGNWGALIHLNENISSEETLTFEWEANVLATSAAKEPELLNTTEWLTSSEIVQANDVEIKAAALKATKDATTTETKVEKLNEWIRQNIKYEFYPAMDASSIFKRKEATCTGYANLGAALGRSIGIPTSTIAGYLTGMNQETHWMNEFYQMSPLSPIRIDMTTGRIPSVDSFIAVRIDRITDEVKWDSTPGLPKNSYPVAPIIQHIPKVAASSVVKLELKANRERALFQSLRTQWRSDFKILTSAGKISKDRTEIRKELRSAKTIPKIEALVKKLSEVK